MLAGLALKWRWLARRGGQDTTRPKLVLGSNVQVVWEKFCRYWSFGRRPSGWRRSWTSWPGICPGLI